MLQRISGRSRAAGLLGAALALSAASGAAAAAAAADLTVNLSGVESAEGAVRIALYKGAEGFRKEEHALQVTELAAEPGTVTGTFTGLAPGEYAVIAYHDENGDGKMNRFLGVIPTEGYGLSNNPQVMGPPGFEDSAFEVPAEGTAIDIEMKY